MSDDVLFLDLRVSLLFTEKSRNSGNTDHLHQTQASGGSLSHISDI
jgi:hypothetical protein